MAVVFENLTTRARASKQRRSGIADGKYKCKLLSCQFGATQSGKTTFESEWLVLDGIPEGATIDSVVGRKFTWKINLEGNSFGMDEFSGLIAEISAPLKPDLDQYKDINAFKPLFLKVMQLTTILWIRRKTRAGKDGGEFTNNYLAKEPRNFVSLLDGVESAPEESLPPSAPPVPAPTDSVTMVWVYRGGQTIMVPETGVEDGENWMPLNREGGWRIKATEPAEPEAPAAPEAPEAPAAPSAPEAPAAPAAPAATTRKKGSLFGESK